MRIARALMLSVAVLLSPATDCANEPEPEPELEPDAAVEPVVWPLASRSMKGLLARELVRARSRGVVEGTVAFALSPKAADPAAPALELDGALSPMEPLWRRSSAERVEERWRPRMACPEPLRSARDL